MKYLLVCDLDDTLTGDTETIKKFNKVVGSKNFVLAYSSGRFKESIISVIKTSGLVYPEIITANLGTEIYYLPKWKEDEEWQRHVKKSWDKQQVISILDEFNLQLQPYDKRFVVPYYTNDESVIKEVEKKLAGYNYKLVHTGNQFLDIIPKNAGKGNAARYVGVKRGLPIICCGDSENDVSMLKKSDYGILVGNSSENLQQEMSNFPHVYVASSFHAQGVIEGLKHHNILPKKE